MRLIDADVLIQKLYEMKAKEEHYIGLENDVSVTIGSIGFEVMNMPTAYDIDNVVEELEKYQNGGLCYQKQNAIDKAIEIVKAGGKNDN